MKFFTFLIFLFQSSLIFFSQQNQSTGNNGVKDGFGVFENNDGVYRGNFVNNKFDGYGEFYFLKGDVIKGSFKNGLMDWVLTYYFSNGDVKISNYKEGKGISEISYSFASKKKVGCVSGDCQNGRGKYIYTNGEYSGGFLYGKQSGQGKLLLPNGDSYEGLFSNGTSNGYGILIRGNGIKYEGNFKNGKKSGIGNNCCSNYYCWTRGIWPIVENPSTNYWWWIIWKNGT